MAAHIGLNCGSSLGPPIGFDPDPKDPPNIWSWPTCEPPVLASTLCAPGTNGWFSSISAGAGQVQWRETCCPPNTQAEEFYDYDEDGNFLNWWLVCNGNDD